MARLPTKRIAMSSLESMCVAMSRCTEGLLNNVCGNDMIKGNGSLVEHLNSNFLAPLSHNFSMLHFDPNPITIGYLVTEL